MLYTLLLNIKTTHNGLFLFIYVNLSCLLLILGLG